MKNMKVISKIALLFVMCIGSIAAMAADIVMLPSIPGTPARIEDLWNLQVIFPQGSIDANALYEVELILTEARKGKLLIERTKSFKSTGTVIINGNTVSDFKPFNHKLRNNTFFTALQSLERFPAGSYNVVFNLYKKSPGGGEEVMGNAETDFSVDEFSALLLQYPPDEDTINELLPTLNWLLLGQKGANCSFEMVLKEIQKNQTSTDAMLYNAIYNTIKTDNIFYPYQPIDRMLQEGGHYAWMVKYLCDGKAVLNSEIWSFTISKKGLKKRPYIDPDAFIRLKDIEDGGTIVIKDRILKIRYQTPLIDKDKVLNYAVTDDKGKEVMNPSIYPLKVNSGDNRYLISLCAEDGYYLKSGKYRFSVKDADGRVWFMNFMIDNNSACN